MAGMCNSSGEWSMKSEQFHEWLRKLTGCRSLRPQAPSSSPERLHVLSDFPVLAVEYAPAQHPFFEKIVVEALRLINSIPSGQDLLRLIAAAKPSHRGDFPPGVNVKIKPGDFHAIQSGLKRVWIDGTMDRMVVKTYEAKYNMNSTPFYYVGGSYNRPLSPEDASNQQGSVCVCAFTNAQCFTNKGETVAAHIVLAHELIHAWHALYGLSKSGKDEELWTTGIGPLESQEVDEFPRINENLLREQFGLEKRLSYY